MSGRRNLKSTSGLLGVTGLTMATLAFAWDQPEPASSLVQKGEDGACVIARIAEARAATSGNMEAKPKPTAADACNPCAGCNPCNPCAAAACNPCNPCGGCNPYNPCAGCNPCNPCAAADACNPCGGCNPCAGDACNPCAAADACNPCAAAACNPCNPCGGCNPCNPCAGSAEPMELSAEEIRAAYGCLKGEMKAAYGMSGENGASIYQDWANYNTQPYISATHGGRYVNNYANATAGAYGKFEDAGPMPVGAVLAKDSFVVAGDGTVSAGPLFLMEKMETGFDPDYGDWKYTLVLPGGTTWGVTNGKNSAGMQFCIDCHVGAEDYDNLWFLPDEFRKK